jgi:hypothetical protein
MTSKEKQNKNLYEWISGILRHVFNAYPLQRSELKPKEVKIVFKNLMLNIGYGR